jgi:hypothetical protein
MAYGCRVYFGRPVRALAASAWPRASNSNFPCASQMQRYVSQALINKAYFGNTCCLPNSSADLALVKLRQMTQLGPAIIAKAERARIELNTGVHLAPYFIPQIQFTPAGGGYCQRVQQDRRCGRIGHVLVFHPYRTVLALYVPNPPMRPMRPRNGRVTALARVNHPCA